MRRVAALAITMALAWLLVTRLGSEPAGSAALALGVALIAASIAMITALDFGARARAMVAWARLIRPSGMPMNATASAAASPRVEEMRAFSVG